MCHYFKHKNQLIFYKIIEDVAVVIIPSNRSLGVMYVEDKKGVEKILNEPLNSITQQEFDAAMNAAIISLIEIASYE